MKQKLERFIKDVQPLRNTSLCDFYSPPIEAPTLFVNPCTLPIFAYANQKGTTLVLDRLIECLPNMHKAMSLVWSAHL